jgi:hypothetical protein
MAIAVETNFKGAPTGQDLAALRMVVRNGTSREMADLLPDARHSCCPGRSSRSNRSEVLNRRGFDHATAQHKS